MFTYFEFHDSVLAGFTEEGAKCVLDFRPAYVHRSEGRPGIDPGDGFWQDLRIVVCDAKIKKPDLVLPADIDDGLLTVGEIRMSNIAPTQFREEKKVVMKLFTMAGGAEIEIEGTSIEVQTIGEPRFAEHFPGSSK